MRKAKLFAFRVLIVFAFAGSRLAVAQDEATSPQLPDVQSFAAAPANTFRPQGTIVLPASSVARPEDAGVRAHTTHMIFVPQGHSMSSPTPSYTFAETPASLACVYKVGPSFAGCNPLSGSTTHASGGWGAIALVDAYDNPNAAADLTYFSSHWGLPAANFTKVYANSSYGTLGGLSASCSGVPAGDTGWGLEEDLDIEYAHAMAPSAKIILVEACSNSYNDLLFAEEVAGKVVAAAGGGDISNSWIGGESPSQLGVAGFDNHFYRNYWQHITYFASSGDYGFGVGYPSTNPWVVSAGGTTINRDSAGNYLSESCWAGSGGGNSTVETWANPPNSIYNGMGTWADYQYKLFGGYPYGTAPRSTPDISADADPASGAWVYDSYGYSGWVVVGGTSLASPLLAGIVNTSNNRLGQAPSNGGYYHTGELDLLYGQLYSKTAYAANFYDVKTGSNGVSAVAGYDQCTGIGSPRGKLGK